MADIINTILFLIFPYIAITVFIVGHSYRYMTDLWHWNARSSEFLHKDSLKYGITIFHWGVLLTLAGHIGGLLVPQRIYDLVGFDAHTHEFVAHWAGMVSGLLMVSGIIWLLSRRIIFKRMTVNTGVNDFVLLTLLFVVSGLGLFSAVFTPYDILYSIAPWIRSIVILAPEPELMAPVPVGYQLHITAALALLAYSPFTRLVHIWSAPVTYIYRSYLIYRKHSA